MAKLAFFDLEIGNYPLADGIWEMWPFSISVGAVAYSNREDVTLWYDKNEDGLPAPTWSYYSTTRFLYYLADLAAGGYKLFGWNSTGFDWQLLARLVPEHHDNIVELCKYSYDPCFQVLCQRGYPVGLNAAAKVLGLQEKELEGAKAPTLWTAGLYKDVLDYVTGDVLRLKGVVESIAKHRGLRWKTDKGVAFEQFKKFHTVAECLQLPQADVSWMTEPIQREESIKWWRANGPT